MAIKDLQQQLTKSEGQAASFFLSNYTQISPQYITPDTKVKKLPFLQVIGIQHIKNLVMKEKLRQKKEKVKKP